MQWSYISLALTHQYNTRVDTFKFLNTYNKFQLLIHTDEFSSVSLDNLTAWIGKQKVEHGHVLDS